VEVAKTEKKEPTAQDWVYEACRLFSPIRLLMPAVRSTINHLIPKDGSSDAHRVHAALDELEWRITIYIRNHVNWVRSKLGLEESDNAEIPTKPD
jgi:hypothetical protein